MTSSNFRIDYIFFSPVIGSSVLFFLDENDQIKLPSGGTLHHFVKYRLGEEGINEIMMLLGEKILKLSSEKEAKIDYTLS